MNRLRAKSFVLLLASAILLLNVFSVSSQSTTGKRIELVVLGHKVHQTAMEGVAGGGKNLVAEFLKLHPEVSNVRFITAGVSEIRDKLFREAAMPNTELDISFLYTPWISPTVPNFFVPIDSYLASSPIEDYDDIFKNLREELIFKNKSYGVPMRASGQGLYYNKKILKERGILNPPTTLEELIEDVIKCSFTRENGEEVYGLVKQGIKEEIQFVVGDWLRAKNGDYITADFESKLRDPKVIEALKLFRRFMEAKAIPPNFTAIENKDTVEFFKQNRGAFTVAGPGYLVQYISAGGLSKEDIGFMNFPVSKEIKAEYPVAGPTIIFQWAFVIPKGAKNKELSWEFIKFMTSKDAVINMSLSGNEPFRDSTFSDPRYIKVAPFIMQQKNIFKYGRPLFRGFDEFPEFRDILGEEIQKVVLGQKTAEKAMIDTEKKVINLLPK